MKHKFRSTKAIFATTFGFCIASAAAATEMTPTAVSFVEDTGSAERIESAEYLRIYSQELVASACFLHNQIEPEMSAELFVEAQNGFEKHIKALMNGDEALGIIGGETRKKTLLGLNKINELWQEVDSAANKLLQDPGDLDALAVLKGHDAKLFKLTDKLLTVIETQYANPAEVVQADVLTIELVGRQAMMSQKIAKYACKIFTSDESDEAIESLRRVVGIYEATLNALLDGLPELGIMPAPTEEIKDKLLIVLDDWKSIRPSLDELKSGATVEKSAIEYLFHHLAEELHKLEEISHSYVAFSKH